MHGAYCDLHKSLGYPVITIYTVGERKYLSRIIIYSELLFLFLLLIYMMTIFNWYQNNLLLGFYGSITCNLVLFILFGVLLNYINLNSYSKGNTLKLLISETTFLFHLPYYLLSCHTVSSSTTSEGWFVNSPRASPLLSGCARNRDPLPPQYEGQWGSFVILLGLLLAIVPGRLIEYFVLLGRFEGKKLSSNITAV